MTGPANQQRPSRWGLGLDQFRGACVVLSVAGMVREQAIMMIETIKCNDGPKPVELPQRQASSVVLPPRSPSCTKAVYFPAASVNDPHQPMKSSATMHRFVPSEHLIWPTPTFVPPAALPLPGSFWSLGQHPPRAEPQPNPKQTGPLLIESRRA